MYISVNVQNGGYLNDAVLELVDTNLKFKNNPEKTMVNLGSISQEGISTGIPVIAKNDESYNLALLNMQSQIRLTGEYIDEQGYITPIYTSKEVKIEWTTNELTNEDIELSQEVITNKIYNMDGANKRVVQLLVKSKIQDNKAPVKSSIIEILNPQTAGTTIEPADVKVASYGTKATNGANTFSAKTENGKTTIEILNDANNDNKVSWAKNAEDIFVVTYVYDYNEEENVELATFSSDVKNTVEVYGRTEADLEKTNQLPLEAVKETGNIANLETSVTGDIYKGKMYIGEDTNYQEESILYVPYSKVANAIIIEDSSDTAITVAEDGEEPNAVDGISTYYKTTKINKANAEKILGTEGTIKVFNAEDKSNPIQEISLLEEIDGDYYTISYNEDVNKIAIEMSAAQTEGTIEILNEKAIKVTSAPTDITNIVLRAAQLKTSKKLIVTDAIVTDTATNNVEMVNLDITNTANLLEPKTTFDVLLDKTSLSTQVENDLKVTVELTAKNERNKLFNAPEIIVELPAEIEEAKIVENGVASLFYDSGLELDKAEIIEDENTGSKKLVIALKGEQKEYLANAATITVDLKVRINSFIQNKNVVFNATCVNNEENVKKSRTITLASKQGLITKNKLTIGENVIEEINVNSISANIKENTNANISTEIMNNFGENISNVNIVGSLPEGITLTGPITIKAQGVTVAYSEDSTNWVETVTDYSKIRAIKVSLAEMANGSVVDLSYGVSVNIENIEQTTDLTNNIVVNYIINEQAKQENIAFTLNAIKEEVQEPYVEDTQEEIEQTTMIEILPKTTIDTLYKGQIVTYEIRVRNTTTEKLENVTLDYTIPEGAVLTELTEAQGTAMGFTDNDEIKNKVWEIKSINPNEEINKEVMLKITAEKGNVISSIASLKDDKGNEIAKDELISKIENSDKISVSLSRRANMNINLTEGSYITYIAILKNNTESEINNITITSKIPELTSWVEESEYNGDWIYQEGEISYKEPIALAPGETKYIKFQVETNKLGEYENSAKVDNTVVATINSQEKYESNTYTSYIIAPKLEINMSAMHNEKLKEKDKVKYKIEVVNKAENTQTAHVENILPEQVKLDKVTYFVDEDNKVENTKTQQKVDVSVQIDKGEKLTIIIEGTTTEIKNYLKEQEIVNVARLDLGNERYIKTTVINTIENDKVILEAPDWGQEDEDTEKPNEIRENSISGLVWIDEDKDGVRDNEEKILQAVKVMLLDKEGNKIADTITSLTGTYEFKNLDNEKEYIVAFEYDTEKYAVATYQVSSISEELNSDVVSKQILIDNKNVIVGMTDIIKIQNKDVTNIDMGLTENPKFDLTLNKYISKVVTTNSKAATTYEYDNTQLAKIEIGAKQLEGTTLLVEYEIDVVNEGDVNGYVTDIIDYMPKELQFNSEMNTEWYLGTDGYLHYMALDPKEIEPGNKQTVKLVLTKTLKANSTGIIDNTAEISEGVNLEGLKDIDSSSNNKQVGEDDISKASLIVSIKTGGTVMYIGIVIAVMAVLGIGIYMINKKVLTGRI